jgi:hypothetical protein
MDIYNCGYKLSNVPESFYEKIKVAYLVLTGRVIAVAVLVKSKEFYKEEK